MKDEDLHQKCNVAALRQVVCGESRTCAQMIFNIQQSGDLVGLEFSLATAHVPIRRLAYGAVSGPAYL